jgi:hypothetical protein
VALPQGDLAADGVRLSLIPGEGGIRRFSGNGELTFRREGSTIAQGNLFARGNVTPGPAIEADLELASARVLLPWLAGEAFGRTRVRVTTTRFHADALTLTLPQGRVSLGPQASRTLGPIRLNAIAGATLEEGNLAWRCAGSTSEACSWRRGDWGAPPWKRCPEPWTGRSPGSNG